MNVVFRYGLHFTDGSIPFLMEQNSGRCLIDGLNLDSPFKVKTLRHAPCPHRFPTMRTGELPDYDRESLLPFLPIPNGKGYWYPELSNLDNLVKFCSPAQPVVFPAWAMHPKVAHSELMASNLSPFVLLAKYEHTGLVDQIVELPRQRNLIVVGGLYRPRLIKAPQPLLPDHSFEQIGYQELLSHARNPQTLSG